MFKLTCFVPMEPKQLETVLKGIHFHPLKNGLEWHMDDAVFRIEPFTNQPRGSMKAYRIYFDGDIDGGLYLFDLSMGCLGAQVTGIEYVLEHPGMNSSDWKKELRKRTSYKMVDSRGIYSKLGVNIVVVNNSVTIQLHSSKNKKLKTVDCLKQVDAIREELTPVVEDLFSFCTEEVGIA